MKTIDPWWFGRLGVYWGMPRKWWLKCCNSDVNYWTNAAP